MIDLPWFFVRLAGLLLGCGILGGWLWTQLAPTPPVHGGILSPAGTLIGVAVGAVIFVWIEWRY